jgi:hypothetical protein
MLKYMCMACLFLLFVAAGFDNDNASFDDIDTTNSIETITSDQFYSAMPSGYAFLTTSGCPSGWSGYTAGYVKLGGSPNLSPTVSDFNWPAHYHTAASTDFTITEGDGGNVAPTSHTHRMRHVHDYIKMYMGTTEINNPKSHTNASTAFSAVDSTGGVQVWQESANDINTSGSVTGAYYLRPDFYVNTNSRYTMLPVSCTANDLVEQYTADTASASAPTAHAHASGLFKDPADIGATVAPTSGDSAGTPIGDFSTVSLRLCVKT